jgi:hypothetical protein
MVGDRESFSSERKEVFVKPRGFFLIAIDYKGDDCLLWPFSSGFGYGYYSYNRKVMHVHRAVCFEVYGGPPSLEYHAAHSCGNRICCNPNHLRWATRSDNEKDKLVQGRDNRGVKHYNSKLSEQDVRMIRKLQGKKSALSVGKLYKVDHGTITAIWKRKSWDWLE